MSAEKLIARIEQMGLLDEQVLANVRREVANARGTVTAEMVAKYLVDGGHVTANQARKLVSEVKESLPPAPTRLVVPNPPSATVNDDMGLVPEHEVDNPPPKPAPAPVAAKPPTTANDDDMGLMPEVGDVPTKPAIAEKAATKPAPPTKPAPLANKPVPKKQEEPEEIILLDDAEGSSGLTPMPSPASKPKPATPAKGLTPMGSSGLTPLADGGLTPLGPPKPPGTGPGKPRAGGAGLTPLPPSGLQPLDSGLTPVDAAGGLTPLDGGSGLTPLGGDTGLTPLGGGGLPPMGGPEASDGGFAGGPGPPPTRLPTAGGPAKPVRLKKQRKSGWDSPLMLMGGGALLLLLFAGVLLIYNLTRATADEVFDRAETEYKNQTYDLAIKTYDRFLKDHGTHDKASLVRVRRGMARLRQAVDQSKDMKGALELAKTVIPEIEIEPRFADGRDELAAMLPKIAEDFAMKAKSASPKQAETLVAMGEQTMELINNPSYISAQLRESRQRTIDTIRENLDEAKRSIQQHARVELALSEMQTAMAANDTPQAFEIRRKVIKDFPAAETDAKLNKIVREVSAKERELVRLASQEYTASKDEDAAPKSPRKLVFSHRKGEGVAGFENEVAFVLAHGAVYGIEVATGKVQWRRFVGRETLVPPQRSGREAGADAIVVDARRRELLRLQARTGKVVWRLAVGEPFGAPAQPDEHLIVGTESGRLIEVDVATGNSIRQVVLPQPTYVPAGGDARYPTFFQIGDHSNLYVIHGKTLECVEVYYLGHKKGAVAVPPVVAIDHLFVVENAGANFAYLHVLKCEKGVGLKPAQDPIRLAGNVTTPLAQARGRVALITNLGEARVFEVDKAREKEPVREVAKQVATEASPRTGYAAIAENASSLWLATNRLTFNDVQTSTGKLNNKWSKHEGESFIAPIQRWESLVLHVRHRRGSPGATITAAKGTTGAIAWRTDVAVPMASLSSGPGPRQFTAINAHGDLCRGTGPALVAGLWEKPSETVEVDGAEVAYAFSDPGILTDGRVIVSNQNDRRSVLVFEPERPSDSLRVIRLATGERAPTIAPQTFGDGLIAPLDNGTIAYLFADNGKVKSRPFQPRSEPGVKVEWQPAFIASPSAKEFVITDSRRKLYRVGIRETPEPNLAAVHEVELPELTVGPLAAAGDTLYAIQRDPDEDVVCAYNRSTLAVGPKVKLKGRVTQGPWSVGDAVILVADGDGIVCFENGQRQRWTQPLQHGPLAGPPAVDDKGFVFASQQGQIWRAAVADGKAGAVVELNETLAGTPVPYATAFLVTTTDGTLIAVLEIPPP